MEGYPVIRDLKRPEGRNRPPCGDRVGSRWRSVARARPKTRIGTISAEFVARRWDRHPSCPPTRCRRRRPSTPSGSFDEGRFPAGTILAERYRIIGLVGQGGMGEVYRASDLKLGQPVALKFLPQATAKNPQLLARFHAEVRIARQVSHPNVCRVYDIGEVDGSTFLSMEYVDGEDLRSPCCAASDACPATKRWRSRASCARDLRPRTTRACSIAT